MMNIHFSSKTDEWSTPRDTFESLNSEYRFTLDPCCLSSSAKCDKYYTPEDDGLSKEWRDEIVFMNPPYGRDISKWMMKAYESAKHHNSTVVCLVPSRTDTRWWHDYAMKGEITFIKGRLKFGGAKNNAPFPSAIVVFCAGIK